MVVLFKANCNLAGVPHNLIVTDAVMLVEICQYIMCRFVLLLKSVNIESITGSLFAQSLWPSSC